jgi:hypothetical protein
MNLSLAVQYLIAAQDASGGWGYLPGHAPVVEPTAAAVLALRQQPEAQATIARAIGWLRMAQHSDGSWGFAANDDESTWHTAWGVLAMQQCVEATDIAIRAGLAWLARLGDPSGAGDDFSPAASGLATSDPAALAWSWLPAEASWVEPTALAALALHGERADPNVAARLEAAARYFAQRRCQGGGWNVGNPVMFNTPLPARACQTAWVLLALSQIQPAQIQPEDLQAMRQDMLTDGGTRALAWGALALQALGESTEEALGLLSRLQSEDGSWGQDHYDTALALLAAGGAW